MIWTEESLTDFEDLRTLLHECQSINTGNNVLQRLETIIGLANKVGRSCIQNRKWSRSSLFHQIEDDFGINVRKASTP